MLQSFVGELDQLQTIFNSISNGVTVSDLRLPDYPLVYVNEAFVTITGYTAEESLGRNCGFLHAAELDQTPLEELANAIEERRITRVILKNHRKDRTPFWNELTISFLLNPQGEPTHLVGVLTDVTPPIEAALHMERQLAHQTTKAQLILENVEDGIYGLDLDGVTTFANKAAEALTGFTASEFLGKRQHEMIHHSHADGSHRTAADCPIYRALQQGQVYRNDDDIFWHKDGSSFPVEYLSKPLIVNGKSEGSVVIFRDISSRKRREVWARAKDAVMQSITNHQPIEESLEQIVSAYAELFPACGAAIFTATPGELQLQAEVGIAPRQKQALLHVDLEDPSFLCVRAAVSRHEIRSSRQLEQETHLRWLAEPAINSSLARPLISASSDTLLGVIQFFAPKEQAFDSYATGWLDSLCDLTRLAIEHHQLYAQLVVEHNRAEQAFRQSEDRFRTLADCCPTLMWMTGPDGDLTFINKKFRELCGTTQDEVSGGKWKLLVHPDDELDASNAFVHAMETKGDYFYLMRLLDATGSWRTIESKGAALLSTSSQYLGHVGFNLDITERLQAELLLRESADRLALALQAGSIGIFDLNVQTGQFIWDDQMLAILGRSRDQFGTDYAAWQSIVPPGDEARLMDELASALRGDTQFNSEVAIVWPDGTLHQVHTLAVVERDIQGKALRMIGANWDVTAQRKAEDDLQRTNQRLQEAMLRSNELASDASIANAAKSNFLATMSHEIRTPMNGVLGMIQLLLTTELSQEQRQFAEIAKNSSGLLLTLIDDILDLSKIEAGKLVIEDAAFDLVRLVTETGDLWRTQGALKGIRLQSFIEPGTIQHVRGDSHRVRQILNNLVSNAVKFTHAGSVSLHVAQQHRQDGKAHIRFAVTDSGIGITHQQQASLFKPFTQADVTTTRKFGGSGLGLAICKQLIEAMGGAIHVKSEAEKGSTFTFDLPLGVASTPVTADVPAQSAAEQPPTVSPSCRARLILVAEDNATNRMVALAQLKKLGYEAVAVNNGAEAVQAVANRSYDLVLMDCEMPVMDGFEATRTIRMGGNHALPILAVTAHAMQSDRDRCLGAGMNDFLSKPVDLRELGAILLKWCPEASPSATPSPLIPPAPPAAVVFDAPSLMNRLMDDKALANLILGSFIADFPLQLELLKSSCDAHDTVTALRQAHGLKGAASAVSACALREALLQMEAIDLPTHWHEFDARLPDLSQAFQEFQDAITLFRQ